MLTHEEVIARVTRENEAQKGPSPLALPQVTSLHEIITRLELCIGPGDPPPGSVYLRGGFSGYVKDVHGNRKWAPVYVQLTESARDAISKHCCDGRIGALELLDWDRNRTRGYNGWSLLRAHDSVNIATPWVTMLDTYVTREWLNTVRGVLVDRWYRGCAPFQYICEEE